MGMNAKYSKERAWILYQVTKDGGLFFTDKAHPISPDAWTTDDLKAKRFDWDSVDKLRKWINSKSNSRGHSITIYLWGRREGEPIQPAKPLKERIKEVIEGNSKRALSTRGMRSEEDD